MARILGRTRPVVIGLTATAAWLLAVALVPPVPANAGLAVLVVAGAVALGGAPGRTRADLVAGLTAGVVAAGSLVLAVVMLMPRVPSRWVAPVVTVALTPADNLSQSRLETVDPYVLIGFIALVLLAALGAVGAVTVARRLAQVSTRRRHRTGSSP